MEKLIFLVISKGFLKLPDELEEDDPEELDDIDPGNEIMNEVLASSDEEAELYCKMAGIDVEGSRKRVLKMLEELAKNL